MDRDIPPADRRLSLFRHPDVEAGLDWSARNFRTPEDRYRYAHALAELNFREHYDVWRISSGENPPTVSRHLLITGSILRTAVRDDAFLVHSLITWCRLFLYET